MCKVLQLSKGGYYKWLNRKLSARAEFNKYLKTESKKIHEMSKGIYGSPRIAKMLAMRGVKASEVLVAKLMKQHQIRSIIRKKYVVTTDSKHKYPVVENKLNRQFKVKNTNEAWVSDLTYVGTKEGWVYLTTVLDLYNRKVIGWSLSNTMTAKDTTIAAFKMAKTNRPIQPYQQLIFHSDRGIHYAYDEFTSLINSHKNITRSMIRKGNCWDNAVAESFFKTLKTELIYQHKCQTKKETELCIFEYIETFYNINRRHSHLNN